MAFKRVCGVCLIALLRFSGLAVAADDVRLVSAAKNGDTAAARSPTQQRVPVNGVDAECLTAVQSAAHWNDAALVRLVIGAGANVRVANRYGVTHLHEASTVASIPIIEALLKAGANPNATYGEGETALMTAARAGSVPAVRALLAY